MNKLTPAAQRAVDAFRALSAAEQEAVKAILNGDVREALKAGMADFNPGVKVRVNPPAQRRDLAGEAVVVRRLRKRIEIRYTSGGQLYRDGRLARIPASMLEVI